MAPITATNGSTQVSRVGTHEGSARQRVAGDIRVAQTQKQLASKRAQRAEVQESDARKRLEDARNTKQQATRRAAEANRQESEAQRQLRSAQSRGSNINTVA